MIYWNPDEVASALRDDRLTERAKYQLLLAGSLLQLLNSRLFVTPLKTWSDVIVLLVGAALTVWGIGACRRANTRGDGRSFLERFVCLAVPLSIRLTLVYLVLAILTSAFRQQIVRGGFAAFGTISLLYAALYVWYFLALRRRMSFIARGA